jgi:hypothetical protein
VIFMATALLSVASFLVGPSTAAASVSFSTERTFEWTYRALAATAGTTQSVTATVRGAAGGSQNGGLVLRSSGSGQFVLANFSGTTFQIYLATDDNLELVYQKPFVTSASGVARAQVVGTALRVYWNTTLVTATTLSQLARYSGRGTGLAIWQERASAVSLTGATSSSSVTWRPPTPRRWLSGAAGDGAANGTFGGWRGTPIQIGGTWNDDYGSQIRQYSLAPGGEWSRWQGHLDVAVGAIFKDRGETWEAAARGVYDRRWRAILTRLKENRAGRPGTVYIRFAHEFNGSWEPWSVRGTEAPAFIASWKRFRALQKSILPSSKLVFCPNDGSSRGLGLDWRKAFPGKAYVDLMSVDSFNQYPWVNSAAGFVAKRNRFDSYGAPLGLERHRLFAASVGLPLAVSEWSSNSSMGDAPVYMEQFRNWVAAHAGTGPGQVPYEIVFNVAAFAQGRFQLHPVNNQEGAAAAYELLW